VPKGLAALYDARTMIPDVAVLVAAYLVGTFPTAMLVGRRLGFDPTTTGSGNPGASNSFRVGGRRAGLLVFLGDVLKGALAAGLGLAVGGRALGVAAAIAAVLGHVAPITRGFRGGKGVATMAGAAIVLYPLVALFVGLAWAVVARTTGKAAVASLVAVVGLVAGVVITGHPAWEVLAMAGLALIVVVRHRSNLVRLVHGTENSLGRGARPA
jgi:glycerol-3-phosphate acyltransferase PlsY